MPHALHVLSVSNFLDFLFCYGVFYCVDRRLNFILITESLKVSTKASVFVVVTVSSIVITSAFVNLPTNAYISATVFFSPVIGHVCAPPAMFVSAIVYRRTTYYNSNAIL